MLLLVFLQKKVIMTGSVNALDAVKKIVQYLDEELEVCKDIKKKKILLKKMDIFEKLENGTALIVFSRAEVLKLKQNYKKKYSRICNLWKLFTLRGKTR